MKNLFIIKLVFNALILLTSVLILGMFIPFVIAVLVYWCNSFSFVECIANGLFIFGSLVGILFSCIYLGHELENNYNK